MSDNQPKMQRPTDAAAHKAVLRRQTKTWLAQHAARQRGPQGELALRHVVDLLDRRERWNECVSDSVAQEKMIAAALFVSLRDEIDLNPLHNWLAQRGVERWVPRDDGHTPAFARCPMGEESRHFHCQSEPVLSRPVPKKKIRNLAARKFGGLKSRHFSFRDKSSVNERRARDLPDPGIPKHCGLLLVPGLAFDRHGNRLGRGKGYYDRLLQHLYKTPCRPLIVGMCLREQVFDYIPAEPHDQPVDAVCVPGEGLVFG